MSGNVWEWCLNEYENPENVNIEGDAPRVSRGGSLRSPTPGAGALVRVGAAPLGLSDNSGFRVVVGAAPLGSGL